MRAQARGTLRRSGAIGVPAAAARRTVQGVVSGLVRQRSTYGLDKNQNDPLSQQYVLVPAALPARRRRRSVGIRPRRVALPTVENFMALGWVVVRG